MRVKELKPFISLSAPFPANINAQVKSGKTILHTFFKNNEIVDCINNNYL